MSNKHINLNNIINRRQFIRRSALGFLGAGAMLTTCKIALPSPHKGPLNPHPELRDLKKPTIPPYNENALFFKKHQYALVATLAAFIIPTDDDPGAIEAGVVDYIDTVSAGSVEKQTRYTNGLKWLDNFSQETYGETFLNLSLENQIDLISSIYDRMGSVPNIWQRVFRKINTIWEELFGVGSNLKFFQELRMDVINGYYSNPVSWKGIGYFGPPQPVGYPNFSEPPSSTHYSVSIRLIDNTTCNTCHEKGDHPRGGLIDHTCTTCHRPHSPWPYDEEAFHLEDHIDVLFPNPDRKMVTN